MRPPTRIHWDLNFDVDISSPGVATATMAVDPTMHNPNGTLQGGVVFTLVDYTMGAATMSVLDENSACATIDLHQRYLRPLIEGTITVRTEVLRRGRHVVHLQSQVSDQDGRVIATADGAFAVLPLTAVPRGNS